MGGLLNYMRRAIAPRCLYGLVCGVVSFDGAELHVNAEAFFSGGRIDV